MSKSHSLLLPLAAGAAILLIPKMISGKTVADALKVNADIHKFSAKSGKLELVIAVSLINPSLSKTSFKSLSGTVFYKTKAVGDITYMSDVVLPARTVTKILIPVKISITESISATFLAILTNKANKTAKAGEKKSVVDFTLKMDVYTGFGKFPFEKTFTIDPKQDIIPKK